MKFNIVVGSLVLGASLCGQSFGGDLLSRLLGGRGCGASSSCCDTSVAGPSCGAETASPCGSGSGCGSGPSCGAEMAAPCSSGCGAPASASCGSGCGAASSCGDASSCGSSSCGAPRKSILAGLHGMKVKVLCNLKSKLTCKSACGPSCGAESSCDPCGSAPSCGSGCGAAPSCGSGCGAAPSCGAEIASCDPCGSASSCGRGCGLKLGKCGLLGKIFAHKKSGCDSASSCDGCASAPASSGCGGGCSSCGGSPVSAPMASPMMAPAPVVDPHAYLNTKRHVIQASSTRIR